MKIAIITDTHFGARNDSVQFDEYFYQFYEGQFFPYLQKNNIKTVLHLGDVLDRRKFVSYRIAKNFRERFILPFQALDIELHALVGNHDIFYKNTNDVNSLQELINDRYKKIHLYPEAQEVTFDGLPILFMPWINSQNYIYAMGMIDETKAQICMGHLDINGFKMNKTAIMSEHGYPKETFKRFETVMSGHFHHKSDDGQIFYLGTPYEIYWNDYDAPKGFHIFDTETRQLDRLINPQTIFDKIYYDDTTTNYENVNVEKYKHKFIKVVVINKKDLYQFDRFIDKLLKIDTHEVKIIEDFTDLDANSVSDDIVENSEDTITLLNKYVDELPVDLNKNRLKNEIRTLYTEAQDLDI